MSNNLFLTALLLVLAVVLALAWRAMNSGPQTLLALATFTTALAALASALLGHVV